MASFSKRSGHWQAKISWYDALGKRHYKTKGGFKIKDMAKKWAVEQESALNSGINIDRDISLVDYYNQWVDAYKKPKVAPASLQHYHFVGKSLKNYFHDSSIKEITRQEYQNYINDYGANHAFASVKKLNSFVRACVKSAILDGYIIRDFTQKVTLTADKEKTIKVDYLNMDEIHRLLDYTLSHLGNRRYTSRYMIITAIYTGMRLAEIQALTWNDIDWLNRTISITKSWDAINKTFKPTKNESSVRKIKVNSQLLQVLSKLKQGSTSNMIFSNLFGTIPTSGAVNKTLRSLLKHLNIHRDNFHFHSLRHSHVAVLLANGIDIYAISKRLGHSNTSTTSQIYAYLIDEYKDKTDSQIISALDSI